MTSKHTPGPWEIRYKNGDTHLYMAGRSQMCDMTYYPWTPENPADWVLIAAAPDMYEALKEILEHFEPIAGDLACHNPQDFAQREAEEAAVRKAKAALAAARGEPQEGGE